MSETYRTNFGRELTRPDLYESGVQLEGVTPEKLIQMVKDFREMASDLKDALDMIRQYQRYMNMLQGPDPSRVAANALLRKYNLPLEDMQNLPFRIYLDGVDITEHPDSVPGTVVETDLPPADDIEIIDAVEVKELEPGD